MTGRLTTHVLDTALGRPAQKIPVTLARLGETADLLGSFFTNADGRCDAPLLQGEAFAIGSYELVFDVGSYLAQHHSGLPNPPFLSEIVIRFGIVDASAHYHVPLLLSPYAYSTYLGS